jgi:hypothetical protein
MPLISCLTPRNSAFNYFQCKELYNKYKDLIGDDDFDDVINRTDFYAFCIDKTMELIGCIYFYIRDNKIFLNGFANRHHHELNVECLKESLRWFDEDIYVETKQKTAKLCILKAGFKKIKNNLYIYRR